MRFPKPRMQHNSSCVSYTTARIEVASSPRLTVYFENQNLFILKIRTPTFTNAHAQHSRTFICQETASFGKPGCTAAHRKRGAVGTHTLTGPSDPFQHQETDVHEQQLPQLLQNRLHFSSCLPYPRRPRQDLSKHPRPGSATYSHTWKRKHKLCMIFLLHTH